MHNDSIKIFYLYVGIEDEILASDNQSVSSELSQLSVSELIKMCN